LNPHLQPGKSTLIGKNLNRGYQKKKKRRENRNGREELPEF
jgi:hypothetical protein